MATAAHTSLKAMCHVSVQYVYSHIICIYTYTNVYILPRCFKELFVQKLNSVLGTCPLIAHNNLPIFDTFVGS